MTDEARLYTPSEAGAVSGLKLKAVYNAIDKRIVNPVAPRFLTGEDLVLLRVWRGVGGALSAERRKRLFLAIAAKPNASSIKADDLLTVDVGEARRQVDQSLRDLEAAEAIVVKDKATLGGEPVFENTRIPVYGIAAMLDAGATKEELLSGYPRLTERMLGVARIWAAAHPRRGRPKALEDLGLTPKSTRMVARKVDPLAGRSKAAPAVG
jgi:uncharacterized protein (DUF433 family)